MGMKVPKAYIFMDDISLCIRAVSVLQNKKGLQTDTSFTRGCGP